MTQKLKKHAGSVFLGRCMKGSDKGAAPSPLHEHIPLNAQGKSINDIGIPEFHILNKKDIEKQMSLIEKKFGMTPEEFHKAWRDGKVHGHEAMKLGCYYEFYKDEYE
jgi:hypothetical protein